MQNLSHVQKALDSVFITKVIRLSTIVIMWLTSHLLPLGRFHLGIAELSMPPQLLCTYQQSGFHVGFKAQCPPPHTGHRSLPGVNETVFLAFCFFSLMDCFHSHLVQCIGFYLSNSSLPVWRLGGCSLVVECLGCLRTCFQKEKETEEGGVCVTCRELLITVTRCLTVVRSGFVIVQTPKHGVWLSPLWPK